MKIIAALTLLERRRADLLERKILRHKENYYAGKPTISDEKYDLLEDELRDIRPNSLVLKKYVAPIKNKKTKTVLPFVMGSLDKLKPGSGAVDKWARTHKGPYLVSDKVDGVSLMLAYGGGEMRAFTKGKTGIVGGDITFLAKHMRLPKVSGKFVIRGEMVITHATFEKYKKEFDNARAMVSGITNRMDVHEAIPAIKFIAYQVFQPNLMPSKAFIKAKQMGFKMVKAVKVSRLSDEYLVEYLQERKRLAPYKMDGLVIVQNKVNPIATTKYPDWAISFKSTFADNIVDVKVTKVEWNETKHGRLHPRVMLEPTRIGDVTVTWTNGKSADFIVKNRIGPGAVLRMTRSGDVIPDIMQVIKPVTPQLPPNPRTWAWDANRMNIYLQNKGSSDVVQVKRITSFFTTMGVESFNEGLVKRFYEDGLDSILKIVKAPVSRFLQIEGVQNTLATKIRTNIDAALAKATLPKLMDASGAFGQGIGTTRAQAVLDVYPNIMNMAALSDEALHDKLLKVPGFKTKTATLFVRGLKKFAVWLPKLPISIKKSRPAKAVSGKLNGQVVVFTGFRDSELEKIIEANGGRVGTSVSAKTTILLAKDVESNQGKASKARQLGVKIMSAEAFRRKYGI